MKINLKLKNYDWNDLKEIWNEPLWKDKVPTFEEYMETKLSKTKEMAIEEPLTNAVKNAVKKAWGMSVTNQQAEGLTKAFVQWKVYNELNQKETNR